ncbi:MAG: hypothetical protein WCJ61_17655, partial [Paludibacter sp.]
ERFYLRQLKISGILEKDEDVKEYIESGEERYGENAESEYKPADEDIWSPIVIFKDSVVDGYSRISTLFHNEEAYISAYVSENSKI